MFTSNEWEFSWYSIKHLNTRMVICMFSSLNKNYTFSLITLFLVMNIACVSAGAALRANTVLVSNPAVEINATENAINFIRPQVDNITDRALYLSLNKPSIGEGLGVFVNSRFSTDEIQDLKLPQKPKQAWFGMDFMPIDNFVLGATVAMQPKLQGFVDNMLNDIEAKKFYPMFYAGIFMSQGLSFIAYAEAAMDVTKLYRMPAPVKGVRLLKTGGTDTSTLCVHLGVDFIDKPEFRVDRLLSVGANYSLQFMVSETSAVLVRLGVDAYGELASFKKSLEQVHIKYFAGITLNIGENFSLLARIDRNAKAENDNYEASLGLRLDF